MAKRSIEKRLERLSNQDASALRLRAEFSPKSVNTEKRTVDLTWTTGAKVLRSDWDGRFFEELSLDPKHVRLDRLNNGAPFLPNHDGDDVREVLGVIERGSANLIGNRGVATVRFATAETDPDADKVFRKIQEGILQNVSVGYRVHKMQKVEGGDEKIPTYRAVDWEPFEVSAVAMGADDDAGFRSFKQEQHTMTEEEIKAAQAAEEAKRAAELKAVQTKAADEARAAERERVRGIQHAVRTAKLDEKVATEMIDKGTTLDAARAQVIDALAARSDSAQIDSHQASGIEVGREASDKFFRAALATSIVKYGMSDMVDKLQKSAPARVRRYFADVDLREADYNLMEMRQSDLARSFLVTGGARIGAMETGSSILKRALQLGGEKLKQRSGGENTTSDYTLLLENLMHKQLLGNYLLVEDTWSKFCGVDTVDDFRSANRYRTGSFAPLSLIPEGEEYEMQSVPDGAKYQVSAQTYGNLARVSRQALMNDDIAGILDTMQKLGRSAALSIEVAVYALLNKNSGLGPSVTYNGNTADLFDASWANVGAAGSGTGTLSIASIDADRTLLASQKDISGNEYIDLAQPGTLILLVPLTLRGQAMRINKDETDISQANPKSTNIVQGLFREVVASPRLTSQTRRYMFADPGVSAAIKVAFLNGERAPFLETKLGWTIDGTELKIRHDFGVQAAEPQSAVTNAGN